MVSNGWKRAIAVLALGGATLAVGGVAGEALAQQAPAGTPSTQAPGPGNRAQAEQRHQQFLAALAAKLNVTPEQLQQAMEQTRQELGMPERGPGGRHGGPGGPGFGRGPIGGHLNAAAQAMNLSVDQLRQELPGKSLTEVAQAHGVDPATVANALKTEANNRIDQAVSAGRLTADQANQMKQNLTDRIDQAMTRQVPADAPQRGGPGHRGGPNQQGGANQQGFGPMRGGPRF